MTDPAALTPTTCEVATELPDWLREWTDFFTPGWTPHPTLAYRYTGLLACAELHERSAQALREALARLPFADRALPQAELRAHDAYAADARRALARIDRLRGEDAA